MNIYTIYRSKAVDGILTANWQVYFATVTYAEGIRFLQSMERVTNVKFQMVQTMTEKSSSTFSMTEMDAADQAGQSHSYDMSDQEY